MLNRLRALLPKYELDAFVVPLADPHGSEYIAPRYQLLPLLTHFTGSAGLAVVTPEGGALWTDSRYFLQAERQLADTGLSLMREGCPGVPKPARYLLELAVRLPDLRVGFPPDMADLPLLLSCGLAGEKRLKTFAEQSARLLAELWPERPAPPCAPVEVQPLRYAGQTTAEKLRRVAAALKRPVRAVLLNDLADIAWLFNLRGGDIAYNCVFMAYALLTFPPEEENPQAVLFTDENRLTLAAARLLAEQGVTLRPYEALAESIAALEGDCDAVEVPKSLSVETLQALTAASALTLTPAASPVEPLRAVKNEAEAEGFREAMLRDGAAMVTGLRTIEEKIAAGQPLDEVGVDAILTAARAAQPGYSRLSFATIAAYGANAAIVHYEAEPATAATLHPRGLLLIDSGAHYDCGTTDITRTLALGPLSAEERLAYTLVLKGHIALSRARFPQGTTGLQLDYAARADMWQHGYDFGHGTGHGVGARLCVHEGPHQIRKNADRPCTLLPLESGFTVTCEPGIYAEGRFGVRIENVLLVVPSAPTPFGNFLAFETLTLCPYDLTAVEPALLTAAETEWLDAYHARVRALLLPRLTHEADRRWLIAKTQPFAARP